MVTARFGLDQEELERRFYAMQPTKGEDAWGFICRVEAERTRLGLGAHNCIHIFGHRVNGKFSEALKTLKQTCRVQGHRFEWDKVVSLAREYRLDQATEKEATQLHKPAGRSAYAAAPDSSFAYSGPACDFCHKRGMISDHPRDKCFVDPASSYYRPDKEERRRKAAGCWPPTPRQGKPSDRQHFMQDIDEMVEILQQLDVDADTVAQCQAEMYFAAEEKVLRSVHQPPNGASTVWVPQHCDDGDLAEEVTDFCFAAPQHITKIN